MTAVTVREISAVKIFIYCQLLATLVTCTTEKKEKMDKFFDDDAFEKVPVSVNSK